MVGLPSCWFCYKIHVNNVKARSHAMRSRTHFAHGASNPVLDQGSPLLQAPTPWTPKTPRFRHEQAARHTNSFGQREYMLFRGCALRTDLNFKGYFVFVEATKTLNFVTSFYLKSF